MSLPNTSGLAAPEDTATLEKTFARARLETARNRVLGALEESPTVTDAGSALALAREFTDAMVSGSLVSGLLELTQSSPCCPFLRKGWTGTTSPRTRCSRRPCDGDALPSSGGPLSSG